jgi:uncharacterized membrane protein
MNGRLVGILCGLGAASIWGGMYVVSKIVLDIIPPFSLVSLRLILGALTLAIVLLARGFPKISRQQLFEVLGVGLVGYGISLSLQFLGTKLSTAANGSLVTSATPAFVLVFASMLLKEKITVRRLIALVLATLGVVAVIDPRSAQLNPDHRCSGDMGAVFRAGAQSHAKPWRDSIQSDCIPRRAADLRPRRRLGIENDRGRRDQPGGGWRRPLFGNHIHGAGNGPLEQRVCSCGCQSCLADVLRAAGRWHRVRVAFPGGTDHAPFPVRGSVDRGRAGHFQYRGTGLSQSNGRQNFKPRSSRRALRNSRIFALFAFLAVPFHKIRSATSTLRKPYFTNPGCCKVQIWGSLYTEGTDPFPSFHGENRDARVRPCTKRGFCQATLLQPYFTDHDSIV